MRRRSTRTLDTADDLIESCASRQKLLEFQEFTAGLFGSSSAAVGANFGRNAQMKTILNLPFDNPRNCEMKENV